MMCGSECQLVFTYVYFCHTPLYEPELLPHAMVNEEVVPSDQPINQATSPYCVCVCVCVSESRCVCELCVLQCV